MWCILRRNSLSPKCMRISWLLKESFFIWSITGFRMSSEKYWPTLFKLYLLHLLFRTCLQTDWALSRLWPKHQQNWRYQLLCCWKTLHCNVNLLWKMWSNFTLTLWSNWWIILWVSLASVRLTWVTFVRRTRCKSGDNFQQLIKNALIL